MNTDDRQELFFQTLNAEGFKRDRRHTRTFRYVGTMHANGRDIEVAIHFLDLEFSCLPTVTLLRPTEEAPDVLAHLSTTGSLCFASDGDIVLDRYNIVGSVQLCLTLAKQGLQRALTHKHLGQEIAAEFPQHWGGSHFYYDLADCESHQAHFYKSDDNRWLLTHNHAALKRFGINSEAKRQNAQPAHIIHLDRDLTFASGQARPKSLADFVEYVTSISGYTKEALFNALSQKRTSPALLFLNAPNGCVGIRIPTQHRPQKNASRQVAVPLRHLRRQADRQPIDRLSGSRFDLKFIFERNMHKQEPLAGKRIALVGCGTIGSHLAKMLVQSGAGHCGGALLILDNQTFEPGNIGRHYLGTPHIGTWKVEAMKEELLRQFPDANISAIRNEALSYLPHLAAQDLIIDATGEEALSVSINHHFIKLHRENKNAPHRLHIWLFGNGAAAQGLLADDSDFACFKCMKEGSPSRWRFSPLKVDVETEQTAAACGEGRFIPYGVSAPTMAAALALQIAIDWSNGDPSPRLRTVSIDKKTTRARDDTNPKKVDVCPECTSFRN